MADTKIEPTFSTPDEIVTLKFGPTAKVFKVHKQFACIASPVLSAAFNSLFEEGQTQTYEFKDVPPEVGRMLVHWIYFQLVDVKQVVAEEKKKLEEDNTLLSLWILADKLIMPVLQNIIITALFCRKQIGYPICTETLKNVYQNTAKDSKLRLFLVDLIGAYMDPALFPVFENHFPPEFLLEIAQRMSEMVNTGVFEKLFGLDRGFGGKGLDRYRVSRE